MELPKPANKDQSTRTRLKLKEFNRSLIFWLTLLIVLAILVFSHQQNKVNANKASKIKSQVVLAGVKTTNVPVYLTAIGNVTPTYSVTVRTQINGILMNVFYREGQLVKQGDLLAQIDPRPYLAQLVQYEGQLKRDTALLANARIDLKRYQTLWRQNSISQQTLATQISLVQQDEGAVKTDQGLIQATKVNLIYTRITSPINGRIGLRLVDPGNFVQTSDTNGLLVINTLNPITVIFTLPEDNIPQVAKQVYDKQVLNVECYDRDLKTLLASGKLISLDNQVDPTTGTVKLRAQFANNNNRLFPSQFVNIKLLIKTLINASTVPTEAIQYSSQGPFIYVLNNNLTVSAKPVKVGAADGDRTSISSGLSIHDLVVIEGADKLTDGAKVKIAQNSQELLNPAMKAKLKTDINKPFWRYFL